MKKGGEFWSRELCGKLVLNDRRWRLRESKEMGLQSGREGCLVSNWDDWQITLFEGRISGRGPVTTQAIYWVDSCTIWYCSVVPLFWIYKQILCPGRLSKAEQRTRLSIPGYWSLRLSEWCKMEACNEVETTTADKVICELEEKVVVARDNDEGDLLLIKESRDWRR